MMRLALNGYGRIGRNILRGIYETGQNKTCQIVAINDLGDVKTNAHLTRFDTVHGPFHYPVEVRDQFIVVDGDEIRVLAERDPAKLPWRDLQVDVVLECTGLFRSKSKCQAHLDAGAKKVIISAPGSGVDATIVYGVNHQILTNDMTVISNASCTTNCLAPLVKCLHGAVGIQEGLMTTIHSYTNDQVLTDVYHVDLYRARAAALNMIPTKTGAAEAVGLVLPELQGRFSGLAVRVPTANVSLVDLSFIAEKSTSVDDIVDVMTKAALQVPMSHVLNINHEPLVSGDFNHNPYSCNFDASKTMVRGQLVKVMAWYDNEWAFSLRMLDTAKALMQA